MGSPHNFLTRLFLPRKRPPQMAMLPRWASQVAGATNLTILVHVHGIPS